LGKPEVTDPKDDDGDVKEEEAKTKGGIRDVTRDEPRERVFRGLQCEVDKRIVWGLFTQFCSPYILIQGGLCVV